MNNYSLEKFKGLKLFVEGWKKKKREEKSSFETVWKRAGTFKKYLAGDWMNHLSITVLPCEAAGFARSCNLKRQIVCYTEPSEKLSLEIIWKSALSKNTWQVTGWTICLSPSITLLPCKVAGFARSKDHEIKRPRENGYALVSEPQVVRTNQCPMRILAWSHDLTNLPHKVRRW